MKRVVMTGASGFIGASLTRRLLREGHEMHLLLRASHQPWRLDEILDHVHCHEVALEDREGVSRAIQEIHPDWIFNLAAYGASHHRSASSGWSRQTCWDAPHL